MCSVHTFEFDLIQCQTCCTLDFLPMDTIGDAQSACNIKCVVEGPKVVWLLNAAWSLKTWNVATVYRQCMQLRWLVIHCNQTLLSSGRLYLCCIYPHNYVLSEILCAIVMECTLHKDLMQFGSWKQHTVKKRTHCHLSCAWSLGCGSMLCNLSGRNAVFWP